MIGLYYRGKGLLESTSSASLRDSRSPIGQNFIVYFILLEEVTIKNRTVWLLYRERGRTSYIEAVVHGHEYRRIGREATHTHKEMVHCSMRL